ncbi:1,4-dihydroxy-2-naphthoate polyprenyltransferase [Candidatus Bipolaricaulota bacterium]|nr:1,4-dihydroxy-2-naphthoate polyprenyltransferase [Candidatus Bipolaricaulota bacterium]
MESKPSPFRKWLMAIRPQTLPAAAGPVIVGTALAIDSSYFAPLVAFLALLGAEFIQIGTNLANDYFDAAKGVDTEDRDGYTRVTQSGLISPNHVRIATAVAYGLAAAAGVYLVYLGGLPILIVGIASIISGLAYTGGPFPFGYYGLGELFVFAFFGVVAVTGTYYVQAVKHLGTIFPLSIPAGSFNTDVLLASLPMAALSTAILVVNNLRDIETDRETGKTTLAVRLGYRGSRAEYFFMLILAYLVPFYFLFAGREGLSILLPLATIPYAYQAWKIVKNNKTGKKLNRALEYTGKLLVLYALFFSTGFLI